MTFKQITFAELTPPLRKELANLAEQKLGLMRGWALSKYSENEHLLYSTYKESIRGWVCLVNWSEDISGISCYVHPEYRKRGLGTKLVKNILSAEKPSKVYHSYRSQYWWHRIMIQCNYEVIPKTANSTHRLIK